MRRMADSNAGSRSEMRTMTLIWGVLIAFGIVTYAIIGLSHG
jgi:hypothetical protein